MNGYAHTTGGQLAYRAQGKMITRRFWPPEQSADLYASAFKRCARVEPGEAAAYTYFYEDGTRESILSSDAVTFILED